MKKAKRVIVMMTDTQRTDMLGCYGNSDARPATWVYTGMTRQRENEEYEPRQLDYATGLEISAATRKK